MSGGTNGNGRMAGAAVLAWIGWKVWQRARTRDLNGDVVLITGGSRGLGFLLAHEYARHGCRIVICAGDARELEHARSDLERCGAEVLAVECDVADRRQVEALVARATSHFGRIDILVNNAGIIQVGPIETMRVEDLERVMQVNFWGAAYATFAVLPQMRQRGDGSIVNITSIGGKVAVPHLLPYDCAKFAMVGLSEGLHAELARDGVRVTTIVPGLMRTGSPVNALFRGNQTAEFSWFSLASATPITTMAADRAARRIVTATQRGEAHVTLTWQASTLRAVHGLAPGLTANVLGAVNRLLPDAASGDTHETRGMTLASPVAPSRLTGMMNRAARDTNQYVGRPQPSPRHAEQAGLGEPRDRR